VLFVIKFSFLQIDRADSPTTQLWHPDAAGGNSGKMPWRNNLRGAYLPTCLEAGESKYFWQVWPHVEIGQAPAGPLFRNRSHFPTSQLGGSLALPKPLWVSWGGGKCEASLK
jgi:hypothetical protein